MTNYGSTSLLMGFSQVLERAMHSRLSQHLHTSTNDILVTEQYGFSKGASNEGAVFRLTDCVFKSINQINSCWRWFGI